MAQLALSCVRSIGSLELAVNFASRRHIGILVSSKFPMPAAHRFFKPVPPSRGSSQQAAQRFEVSGRVEDGSDRDAEARDDAAFVLSGTGLQEQAKGTSNEHILFGGLGVRIDEPILADAVAS